MSEKIRLINRDITVDEIKTYIDNAGREHCIAYKYNFDNLVTTYRVAFHDSIGPVWHKVTNIH